MCIICDSKNKHKTNLDRFIRLNVSSCKVLTSEKLQEILNQCKNLRELQCSYCSSLTSLELRNNTNLEKLQCYHCISLTSLNLQENKNLRLLSCFNCISLTSLNLRNNINLIQLWCFSCISLTSLHLRSNKKLKELRCDSCDSLTSLYLQEKYYSCIYYFNCPWIVQNKYFTDNLQNLIKLQRWWKRLLIIKYLKSLEFVEWFYNPNNIGGRLHKLKLLKEFIKKN